MKKGYTLIELVGVIIIISILITLAFHNVLQGSIKMREISDEKVQDAVITSAKQYVEKNKELKSSAKSGNAVKIYYTTLRDEGYLPKTMIDVKTYKNMNITDYVVCLSYDNGYVYEVTVSSNCK